MTPQTPSTNAPYWFMQQVARNNLLASLRLRLDPFMWGPTDRMEHLEYKMQIYGKPLNWERIANLREAEHGLWLETDQRRGYSKTEYSWDPRDDGVHFVCEEVPTVNSCHLRAARYIHAIYSPESETLIHFDGALRIYNADQIGSRDQQHVRNAGKAGVRIKLFSIDRPVSRDCFSSLVAAFFVWNDDVINYFT